MERDVVITYETLYEILRREKIRTELQPLSKDFLKDVVKYLGEKQSILDSQMNKVSIFSSSENHKTQKQIENIKRMIKEIYERRESKIVQMALFHSRVCEEANCPELLDEERLFYNSIVSVLNKFRKDTLFNMLSLKNPEIKAEDKPKELKTEDKPTNKLIRFLHATPQFVGEDLKVYGPFEDEDVAALPLKVAEVLVKSNRAEVMAEK